MGETQPPRFYDLGRCRSRPHKLRSGSDEALNVAISDHDSYFNPNGAGTGQTYMKRSMYNSSTEKMITNLQNQTHTLNQKPKPTPPAA
jgi:hypothetical protein